jgi:chromatin structure-remodeling complex subunit RSC4
MMKRELDKITGAAVDVDAPRSKRRREGPAQDETESVVGETAGNNLSEYDLIKVKEEGTKLWTTIREAVNKE